MSPVDRSLFSKKSILIDDQIGLSSDSKTTRMNEKWRERVRTGKKNQLAQTKTSYVYTSRRQLRSVFKQAKLAHLIFDIFFPIRADSGIRSKSKELIYDDLLLF